MKSPKRIKAFFTINPELYKEFELYIEDKLLDKSKLIEFLIKDFINKNKNTNEE